MMSPPGWSHRPVPASLPPPASARVARLIATVAGLGDLLPIPGTLAGSLPAALSWWGACLLLSSTTARAAATAGAFLLVVAFGTWAADVEARRQARSDPGSVVVDEVAGQWLTYLPSALLLEPGSPGLAGTVVGGFLLFRILDVVKPWPVRRLERLPGGVGIMADDLAAGALAAAALTLASCWLG